MIYFESKRLKCKNIWRVRGKNVIRFNYQSEDVSAMSVVDGEDVDDDDDGQQKRHSERDLEIIICFDNSDFFVVLILTSIDLNLCY